MNCELISDFGFRNTVYGIRNTEHEKYQHKHAGPRQHVGGGAEGGVGEGEVEGVGAGGENGRDESVGLAGGEWQGVFVQGGLPAGEGEAVENGNGRDRAAVAQAGGGVAFLLVVAGEAGR